MKTVAAADHIVAAAAADQQDEAADHIVAAAADQQDEHIFNTC